MVFGSPKQRSIPDGVTPKEARDCAVAAFQNPIRQAEKRDVTICFEPLSAAETNFINTAAEAIRSEEHTSELQSQSNLVCRLLLEKKKKNMRDSVTVIASV